MAGSVLSSAAFTSAGVASTTADGNWSFNNMSMDNLSQNKMDTNLVQRQGQQTWQADNGSTQTQTAGGHTVIDGSGAMSNLPVNMKLSQLASSGFQESARQAEQQARTSLDGYNHSVTSGWSQLSQLSNQNGTSDSVMQGSENSQAMNATRGASMMMSAAESYAKANNISRQEAYNELMSKSVEGSVNAGASGKFNTGDQAFGKVGKWATGVSLEAHAGAEVKGASGSSHGTQENHSSTQDMRHDNTSQAVNDFRQGMDMVSSSRVTDGSNHTENAATSNVQQFAATLNDAQSQYHQYTTSSTSSNEFSRMATLAQNESASLDTNYTQEFVDWAGNKYGDKAQAMLTSAPSAREAAMEFVNERLKPEIMGDYQQGRADLVSGNAHEPFSGAHIVPATSVASEPGYGSTRTAGDSGYTVEGNGGRTLHSNGQSAENNPSTVTSGGQHHLPERGTESDSSGQVRYEGPRSSSSGRNNVNAETIGGAAMRVTDSGSSGRVHSGGVNGDDMRSLYNENQARLKEHAGEYSGPQNEIQQKVAGQRSENEQNINKSAGEISKKQSTVQTSSGILIDEHHNSQSSFSSGLNEERIKQGDSSSENEEEMKRKLAELRARKSG